LPYEKTTILEVWYAKYKASRKTYEKRCQKKAKEQVSPFKNENLYKKV